MTSPDVFMPCKDFTITNQLGIHARPAAQFVKIANSFPCDIRVEKDDDEVDGKSILDLLTLAAEEGTRLVVEATGPDATEALDAIGSLFEQKFALKEENTRRHTNKTKQEKQISSDSAGINTAACEDVAERNTSS